MNNTRLTDFLGDAYRVQSGEYYPETHQKNLRYLSEEYPEYPEDVIDCLYRFAIHLDVEATRLGKEVNLGECTKEAALDFLAVTFYHFSKGTRRLALEMQLTN